MRRWRKEVQCTRKRRRSKEEWDYILGKRDGVGHHKVKGREWFYIFSVSTCEIRMRNGQYIAAIFLVTYDTTIFGSNWNVGFGSGVSLYQHELSLPIPFRAVFIKPFLCSEATALVTSSGSCRSSLRFLLRIWSYLLIPARTWSEGCVLHAVTSHGV
jgi:hypothetical protein